MKKTGKKKTIIGQKRAGEALRESEERFRRMFEQSTLGMALSDNTFRFTSANPAFCAMLGYTEAELLKLTFKDITHPDHLSKDTESIQKLARGRIQFYKTEKRYITKSGAVVEGAVTVTALHDDAGKHVQSMVTLENITKRRQTESQKNAAIESLRVSEENYRMLAENMKDVLFRQDLDHTITYVSPSAEKLFGYTRKEACSLTLDKLLTPESLARVLESFRTMSVLAAKADVEVPLLELEYVRKNGSTFWGELHVDFLKDRFGKLVGMQGVVRDITERKKTEAMLVNAQKLDSLGVLAGGIAHDFNNLLGGIFGYLSLANACAAGGTLEHVPEYLTKALDVFERARALTQQLLTFSKGGAPVLKTLRLAPLLKKWAQFALSGSSVVCRCAIADDLRLCDCDENQIGQVIDNIIINAKQAMPMGGDIVLTAQNVSVKQDSGGAPSRNGDFIKISIKDHGIGMPKEILPRIFDPFFSSKETGHGLGLTTSYSIISRHGGFIDVESEPGKGSAFHIFLPASKDSVPSSSDEGPMVHKGSGTFLIMDDEEMIRKPIGDMLKLWGYIVASMETGRQAIDFLESEIKAGRKLAGMILDLTVPGGMGGKEAIKEIRKLSAETPVFVTSGYANDPVMANPKDFGFMASIRKPFTADELAGMMNKHLKT